MCILLHHYLDPKSMSTNSLVWLFIMVLGDSFTYFGGPGISFELTIGHLKDAPADPQHLLPEGDFLRVAWTLLEGSRKLLAKRREPSKTALTYKFAYLIVFVHDAPDFLDPGS